jgi:hypothetical protein
MSTQFLGSDSFTVIPDVNGNPLTVSTGGTIPSVTGGSGAPSGAPTYGAGSLYVDVTNYNLYLYQGSAWNLVGYENLVLSVSTNTTAANVINVNYTYLVSGTTTITLPTAIGNLNTYTIKNAGTGVATVATTSSQTIDGSTTASLPVRYTSLTLVSDGANWNII